MSIAIIKEASGFILHTDYITKTQNQAITGLELNIGDELSITSRAKCVIEYNTGATFTFQGETKKYIINEADAGEGETTELKADNDIVIASGVVKEEEEIRTNTMVEDNEDKDEYFESLKESIKEVDNSLIPIPRVVGAREGLDDGSLEIYPADNETIEGDSLFIEYEDKDGKSQSVNYVKVGRDLWEKKLYPIVACFPNRSSDGVIVVKPGEICNNTEVMVSIIKATGAAGEIARAIVLDKDYVAEEKPASTNEEELENEIYEEDKSLVEDSSNEEDELDSEPDDDDLDDEDNSDEDDDETTSDDEEQTPDSKSYTPNEDDELAPADEKYREQRAVRQDSDYEIILEDEENNEGDRYIIIYLLDGTQKRVTYVKNNKGMWVLEEEDAEGVFSDSKEVRSTITYYFEGLVLQNLIYEPYREQEIDLEPIGDDGDIDYKELDQFYTLKGTFNKNRARIGHINGQVFVGSKSTPLKFMTTDPLFYTFEAKIPKEHLLGNDLFKIEINYDIDDEVDVNMAEREEAFFLINYEEEVAPSKPDIKEEEKVEAKEPEPTKEEEPKQEEPEQNTPKQEVNPEDFADLSAQTMNQEITLKGAPNNGLILLFIDVEGSMPRVYSIEEGVIRSGEDDIGNIDGDVANFIIRDMLVYPNSKITIKSQFYAA